MRVLFANGLYYKGHKLVDNKTISNMCERYKLTVMSPIIWYEKKNGIQYKEIASSHYELKKNKKLLTWKASFDNYKKAYKFYSEQEYDLLVLNEFEIHTFFVWNLIYRKIVNVLAVHHSSVDQIVNNSIKRILFYLSSTVNPIIKIFLALTFF